MPRESDYQNRLIKLIEREVLPGSVVIKSDPARYQGHPDLIIFYGPYWAMLEVKMSASSPVQPNQPYWVEQFDNMGFAAFIYPENEEEVLDALQSALGAG